MLLVYLKPANKWNLSSNFGRKFQFGNSITFTNNVVLKVLSKIYNKEMMTGFLLAHPFT